MRTKTLQIRIPEELRKNADHVLTKLGIDMPTAVRMYLTRIVASRSIPFKLELTSDVTVEEIAVTPEIQAQMDDVASVWPKRARKAQSLVKPKSTKSKSLVR